MKFRIEFTAPLKPVEVEIDLELVESFARHYCMNRGMDPATGHGPQPLHIVRLPDDGAPECPQCGYSVDVFADHNSAHGWWCNNCREMFEDKRGSGNEDRD